MQKYVLDTNCYLDASRDDEAWAALQRLTTLQAPRLCLSSVVAAELRGGTRSAADRAKLEMRVLGPYVRRGRLITPSAAAWDALGLTLASLRKREGLALKPATPELGFRYSAGVLLSRERCGAGDAKHAGHRQDPERVRVRACGALSRSTVTAPALLQEARP